MSLQTNLVEWNLDITNPLHNKVFSITKLIFFTLVILEYREKNLDIMKPHYSKHIACPLVLPDIEVPP